MVRFLQISDIHFRRLPDARDEYAQLKARLFEKVREICTTLKVDCILICGDVAFSGNTEEYEQRAKVFINNLLEITQCQTAQVYMVPGNHDKDRNAKYQNTRWMFRECMLNAEKIDNHFFDLYKEENDVYSKCLMPFDAYYNFANNYRCVPEAVANTRNRQPRTYLDRLNWTDDLKVGQYTLRLHGINTCYVSDKEDENHKQILPNELFYATKNNGVVNVSVMHHPLDFIKDKKDIEKAMDELYPIQFYGHVHHQSIEKNGTLKIFSGAIMPPKGESNCEDGYEPVFNIIEFKDGHGFITVTVNPYQWEWTSKNDGRFNAIQPEPSCQINVDDSSQYALSIEKPLKLPKGVTKKEIEVEFLQSTKSEEIIHKMYNAFEFQNDAVADASTFFRHVKDEERYVELYNFIHE